MSVVTRRKLPADEYVRADLIITVQEQLSSGKTRTTSYPGNQCGVSIVRALLDAPNSVLTGTHRLIEDELAARGSV